MSNEFLSPGKTRRVLGVSDRRLRQPDLDQRLQPIRAGHARVYRADAVGAELDRRIDNALARKDRR